MFLEDTRPPCICMFQQPSIVPYYFHLLIIGLISIFCQFNDKNGLKVTSSGSDSDSDV